MAQIIDLSHSLEKHLRALLIKYLIFFYVPRWFTDQARHQLVVPGMTETDRRCKLAELNIQRTLNSKSLAHPPPLKEQVVRATHREQVFKSTIRGEVRLSGRWPPLKVINLRLYQAALISPMAATESLCVPPLRKPHRWQVVLYA